jgi:Asp/Glu/hydantoin racemase
LKNLLLINGNTTDGITATLAARAQAQVHGRALITARSAVFGPPYIENRTDALIAGHAVLATAADAIAKSEAPFDAAIIACFGEPGLGAMREAMPFPVVGMAEAGMLTAMQIATRFAILTPGVRWPAMLWELVGHYGLRDRCAAIRPLDMGGVQLAQDPEGALDRVPAGGGSLPVWSARKASDPAGPLARAYLDVNCAHCHQPGGGASNSGLDLRWEQADPHAYGIMKRPVAAGRGAGDRDFSIVPGHTEQSILLYRMDSAEPGIAMPELGRSSIDHEGVALVGRWIAEMK